MRLASHRDLSLMCLNDGTHEAQAESVPVSGSSVSISIRPRLSGTLRPTAIRLRNWVVVAVLRQPPVPSAKTRCNRVAFLFRGQPRTLRMESRLQAVRTG